MVSVLYLGRGRRKTHQGTSWYGGLEVVAELEKLLQEVLGEKVLLCRRKKLRTPLRNSLGVLRRRCAV